MNALLVFTDLLHRRTSSQLNKNSEQRLFYGFRLVYGRTLIYSFKSNQLLESANVWLLFICVCRSDSLFGHAGVFQDVHVDEERLLVFAHPTQQQRAFLQQAFGDGNKVKGQSFSLNI